LVVRKIAQKLNSKLEEAVKVVNFINAHPLNAHIFNGLCKEMSSACEQQTALTFSSVLSVSQKKVLACLFQLCD
jgi:hypothetical protein